MRLLFNLMWDLRDTTRKKKARRKFVFNGPFVIRLDGSLKTQHQRKMYICTQPFYLSHSEWLGEKYDLKPSVLFSSIHRPLTRLDPF